MSEIIKSLNFEIFNVCKIIATHLHHLPRGAGYWPSATVLNVKKKPLLQPHHLECLYLMSILHQCNKGSYLSSITITNAVVCSSIHYPIKLNLRNQVLSRDHRHFSSSFYFCHCSRASTKILSMQMKVLEESLGAEVLLSKGFWLDYSNAPRGIYSRFKLEVSVTMMALLLANKKTIHSILK